MKFGLLALMCSTYVFRVLRTSDVTYHITQGRVSVVLWALSQDGHHTVGQNVSLEEGSLRYPDGSGS